MAVWATVTLMLAIASLDLVGWMIDVPFLRGITPQWTPMKIITALGFILSATALVCLPGPLEAKWRLRVAQAAGVAVSLAGLVTAATYLAEMRTGQEAAWAGLPVLNVFLSLDARMAVITAALFSAFGGVLILFGTGRPRAAALAHALLLPITMMAYLIILGYLFGIPEFYKWLGMGVALNTGVAFCALCVAAFCVRPETWLLRVLTGGEAGAVMARRLLPPLLVLPLVIGWLRIQGEQRGFFESTLGVALVAVTYTVCFFWLLWLTAKPINRTDQRRRRAEETLRESEQRYRALFSGMTEGFALHEILCNEQGEPCDYRFLDINPAFEHLTGLRRQDVVGRTHNEVLPGDDPRWIREYGRVAMSGESTHFENYSPALKRHFEVFAYRPAPGQFAVLFMDITERRLAEEERSLTVEFLRLANAAASARDLVRDAITFFQHQSGCEAVGLRLKDGEDYPYYEARGFPEAFLALENSLCARDPAGLILRDEGGKPIIECMCGNVLLGRTDPSLPFFTPFGSFWSNGTTELLATTSDPDRQTHTRNRCNGEGYESVALIPLRLGDERLGLLQLNDRRPGRFSPEMIALWERLSGHLAAAMAKIKAEEALRKSQAQQKFLSDLLERSEQPFGVGYPDGRLGYINKAFAELTGYSHDELAAMDWTTVLTPPEWREAEKAKLEELNRTGQPVRYEKEYRKKDGSRVPIELLVHLIKDDQGRPLHYYSFLTDITERKRAEGALHQLNAELETRVAKQTVEVRRAYEAVKAERQQLFNVLETLPVYVILLSKDYHVPFANRTFERLFGKSDGRRCYEYLFSRTERCEDCQSFKALETQEAHHWQWTGPNGREYDIFDFPFTDTDGSQMVLEMGIDITEQKQAEAALRASSLYARSLLEASLDPLVTISPEGKITDVNEATEKATGVPRGRLIGSDFSDYFTQPDQAREGYQRVIAEGFVLNYPLTIRHTSGRTLDVLYNATVYRDEAGRMQGVFAAARDITERNRAERELAKYRNHLEDLVQQRTEALRHTAEELARSNKDLEQFAYISSHDLQEPLRMVTGFVQLLEDRYKGKLDAQADEYIHFAVDGAKRMQSLINDLLTYSRTGTRDKDLAMIDSGQALRHALANLQAALNEAGAQVTVGHLPTVQANGIQLAQLFQNLVGNAIKFRGTEPPAIHIDARRDGGEWVFSIRDNGIGIKPEFQDRIFMIFQRLHTRQQYPGTGIGLAICKKIVERHGGRIWVESEAGRGATFYFTWPAQEDA
jgi:PAS domain S-box-containing protein